MAPQESNAKKIERKAKSLLLDKDIPASKMEIVRSLMQNSSLVAEEKYRAIIELIQSCPDKPRSTPRPSNIEVRGRLKRQAPPVQKPEPVALPAGAGTHLSEIIGKYKKLRLFKKRYLINSDNRFGISFRKRLVPAKRFFDAVEVIGNHQEALLENYSAILIEILKDDSIEDPMLFNHLTAIKPLFTSFPLEKYSLGTVKWMDRRDFEIELRDYVRLFFSIRFLDAEIKEQMLALVDQKLRAIEGFNKSIINEKDSSLTKAEKEKQNLNRDRKAFDYLLIMRSFISAGPETDNALSRVFSSKFGIPSLSSFLIILLEALVFQCEMTIDDIKDYFRISPPAPNSERWNYSIDILRQFGKDPESRKKRRIMDLRKRLEQYEDIYIFLKFETNGRNILEKCFDEQWRIVDKKRQDSSAVYEEDFFSFIDGCVHYFNNAWMPLLDGSIITFEESNGRTVEGRLFSKNYFERDRQTLDDILAEIYYFRTNNPNMVISLQEARRVLKGSIKTLAHIEVFLKRIGGLFFAVGTELHRIYDLHRIWARLGNSLSDSKLIRIPLTDRGSLDDKETNGHPIPFYDCRIKSFQEPSPLMKTLAGSGIINADFNEGVIVNIIAFCYQLAYQCQDDSLSRDLDTRKSIIAEIKDLTG